MSEPQHSSLQRRLGTFGAIMLGLGAMLGTGVFVSLGIAAGITGPAVILAVVLAAAVAACNGLSSAQLAARYPVSGGTYEYAYRLLNPALGFSAGWMFLIAKSASAATAALGFAGYLSQALDLRFGLVPSALATVALLTAVALAGIERSHRANVIIVGSTLLALLLFVAIGAFSVAGENFRPFFTAEEDSSALPAFMSATALVFVAFTGYGRIATLGEEVREPSRTIPRAVVITMIVTALLYASVAAVGVGLLGAAGMSASAGSEGAPLAEAAGRSAVPGLATVVTLGALAAMLGVLLNLLLGLSRVLLAMARRGDMPVLFTRLNPAGTSPVAAVLGVAAVVALLAASGDIRFTWSFSAFTVLIYYAITNLAALRLRREERLFPAWVSALGLLACLSLAIWIDWRIIVLGVATIGAGLLARHLLHSRQQHEK